MAFPSQDSLQFGWNLLFAPELLFPNPAWRIPNLSMYNDYIQFAAEQLTQSNLPDPREAKAHLTNFPLDYESSVRQMQNFLHCRNLPHPDIASLSGCGVQTSNTDEKIKRSSSFSPEAMLRSTESNPPTHAAETSLKRLDSVLSRDVSFRKENNFPETNCRNGDLNPNHPTYPESNGEKPFLKFGVSAILSLNDIPQMERNSPESTTLPNSSRDRTDPSPGLDPRPSLIGQPCHMFSQQPHSRYPYYATHGTYMHSTPLPPVLPSWFPGASRGRARRGMLRRAVFSDSQRKALEKKFQQQKYIGKPDRKKLAQKLGLKDSQVKIWFQNRRMKWRNTQERQMMTTAMSSQEKDQSEQSPIVSR